MLLAKRWTRGSSPRVTLESGQAPRQYDRHECYGATTDVRGPEAPQAEEPGAALARADLAARNPQPCRAWADRRRRPRCVRPAGLRRLRHGAVPAARGVPPMPVDPSALARAGRPRTASLRDRAPSQPGA